jgi:hypothetical protein
MTCTTSVNRDCGQQPGSARRHGGDVALRDMQCPGDISTTHAGGALKDLHGDCTHREPRCIRHCLEQRICEPTRCCLTDGDRLSAVLDSSPVVKCDYRRMHHDSQREMILPTTSRALPMPQLLHHDFQRGQGQVVRILCDCVLYAGTLACNHRGGGAVQVLPREKKLTQIDGCCCTIIEGDSRRTRVHPSPESHWCSQCTTNSVLLLPPTV